MKHGKRIKGVLAPVVTPFGADLSPDPVLHCSMRCSRPTSTPRA